MCTKKCKREIVNYERSFPGRSNDLNISKFYVLIIKQKKKTVKIV